MDITVQLDDQRLAEILSTDQFMDPIHEAVAENESLRYAAQEAGSEAGSESGSEAGWEAGRDAAREEINDSDSGGIGWGSLRERMENEFTGRSYEGGCSEWRAYFGAIEHGMRESARLNEDGGYITGFLNEFRHGIIAEIPDLVRSAVSLQAGTGEGTDHVPPTGSPTGGTVAEDHPVPSAVNADLATTTNESLTKRVQELELLVAGLGQALTRACVVGFDSNYLKSYADTAERHQWPAWMAGLVTNTTT